MLPSAPLAGWRYLFTKLLSSWVRSSSRASKGLGNEDVRLKADNEKDCSIFKPSIVRFSMATPATRDQAHPRSHPD
jgi:hypothetical protein